MSWLRYKLSPDTYRDVVLLGKKIGAEESLSRKIVDFVVDRKELKEKVHAFAMKISEKARFKRNFQALKKQMYEEAFNICYNRGFIPEELEVFNLVFIDNCVRLCSLSFSLLVNYRLKYGVFIYSNILF